MALDAGRAKAEDPALHLCCLKAGPCNRRRDITEVNRSRSPPNPNPNPNLEPSRVAVTECGSLSLTRFPLEPN